MKFNPLLTLFLMNEAVDSADTTGIPADGDFDDMQVHAGDNEDDFEIDLTDVDTSIPLLEKSSNMVLKLKKATVMPNKDKTGRNAVFYFTNAEPAISVDSIMLPAGAGLMIKYCPLQPNPKKINDEGYDPNRWTVDLATVIDAVYGTEKGNRPKWNRALAEDMKDRLISAKVEIEQPDPKAATDFGPKNIIKSMKFLAQ